MMMLSEVLLGTLRIFHTCNVYFLHNYIDIYRRFRVSKVVVKDIDHLCISK